MKKTKKLFSILLSCLMLMSLLSVGAFAAEGTQSNPINANDKWFGYGVDCFLMNTTLAGGDTDGVWYRLTADAAGILHVEHSSTEVDYQINLTVNGQEYLGYENGVYNKPIMTLPVAVGDVITIHIIAQDTSLGGMVYCNAKFINGSSDINQMVKLKGANVKVCVANGATVYLQDDSLQGEYAAQGLKLQSSVAGKGVTVISGGKNYTDTDGDGFVELKLGGSAGSTGAPAVKPSFAIQNLSGEDAWFVLNVVANTAHECVYADDTDVDCNTCGEIRDVEVSSCEHEYVYPCDTTCTLCGELARPTAAHVMTSVSAKAATCSQDGNVAYYCCDYCNGCWEDAQGNGTPLTQQMIVIPATGEHTYDGKADVDCNVCGAIREVAYSVTFVGTSVSQEVNGLAASFQVDGVAGIQMDGFRANYDNATIGGHKLIGMGAVVANGFGSQNLQEIKLENVDDNYVLNVPATYLLNWNEAAGAATYAVRIVDIPDVFKDEVVRFRPYFIYENANGEQVTVYDQEISSSYDTAA